MSRLLLASILLLGIAACARAPEAPSATAAATVAPALDLPNLARPQPGLYTAGKLARDDVAQLQAAGIRHVIDLTRDEETPDFDEAAAVRAAGIRYDNLPIAGAQDLTRENVEAFDRLLDTSTEPLLVHCASSNRVGALAALRAAWIEGKPVEVAIEEGRAWGLRSLEDAVRERLAN
jgi:uncharacterized protein (TIGR01244 family)